MSPELLSPINHQATATTHQIPSPLQSYNTCQVPAQSTPVPIKMSTGPTVPDNVKSGIAYLCNSDSNRSLMCWYDNASVSNDGVTLPQAADPVGPTNGPVTWEGQTVRGIIMSSNKPTDFATTIGPNAQSANFQDQVGIASLLLLPFPGQPDTTDYFANFSCFKDDARVVYTDANFGKVYCLYYCTFANAIHGTG